MVLDTAPPSGELLTKVAGMCADARQNEEVLAHMLITGPTSLGVAVARFVSREMGIGIREIPALALTRPAEVAVHLADLERDDILLIADIGQMPNQCEALLRQAMRDFKMDIPVGTGLAQRVIQLLLAPITVIGVTTHSSTLSSSLNDLFALQPAQWSK
jgi:Holliday junction DNA helicase RuvB